VNKLLHIHRLEFSVTYRCNAHCKHCQVGEDKRASHPAAIDGELAARIVHRVAGAYQLRSLMTFGGEPLLYPDAVCAIHAAATQEGIPHRSIITNAGVPRSEAAFREVARRLAESGVNGVWISVDAFHQEHIPVEIVARNVRALADAGIDELVWNPCWVVSREHDNPWNRRTRDVLATLAHLPAREDAGNTVQPKGHAPESLADYLPPKVPLPTGTCGDMPYTDPLDAVGCVSIEPDGGVSVCEDLIIGNAAQRDIIEILNGYDPRQVPETRAILEGGMAELVELARGRGIEPDPTGYYSICDMCTSLRRRMDSQ
jgi:pyruvate-formate lyase-activating enzyme